MSGSNRPARSLQRVISIQLAMVAAGLFVFAVVITIVEYSVSIEKLRQATLEAQAQHLLESIRSARPPDFTKIYQRYPSAYGYRVFNEANEVLAALNPELFHEMPHYPGGPPDLAFKHYSASSSSSDKWTITRVGWAKGGRLWLNLTMVGDPAALWREVIFYEILEHVVLPAFLVVPALSFTIFLALRSALKPMKSIAGRARVLALQANSGTSLQKLPSEGLPRETLEMVAAINALLRKSESILEQQKQFAANAAHELRTPLAVLQLQISRLSPSEAVDRLKSDVAVMSRVIDQLLGLSQAEQLAKAGFSWLDLRDVARAACEEMTAPAALMERLIELDEPATPAPIACNPEFVKIAIRNIIENALRAAPVGSTVSVAVDSHARVSVSDRGRGIPADEKDEIFKRFWTSAHKKGEGAGIGLALVRRIVELHDGEVLIEDRDGGGAIVTLSFAPDGKGENSRQLGS